MKVKCIANKLNNSYYADYIEVDKEYVIYGIIIYEDKVHYLISDSCRTPFWYPAELFVVINNLLPFEWYYNFYGDDFYLKAIFGYKELIFDDAHSYNILEREQKDLEIFCTRKKEIDEYEDLNSPIVKVRNI